MGGEQEVSNSGAEAGTDDINSMIDAYVESGALREL